MIGNRRALLSSAHVLLGKPVPTFPGHALLSARRQRGHAAILPRMPRRRAQRRRPQGRVVRRRRGGRVQPGTTSVRASGCDGGPGPLPERQRTTDFHRDRIGAPPYGLNGDLGLRYQSVGGRIPHQDGLREKVDDTGVHRDVTLTRRAMDSLGVDNMVVFPTPMLFIGLHPQPEMEIWLSRAYNKWMQEKLLSADDRIKFLAVLPYNTPEECERIVTETAGKKGIIGYAVPSTRHAPVHHNKYMRLYRMIEETDMPISFHAGYHWDDPSLKTVKRFLGMHALGFAWPNMLLCTTRII